MKIEDILKNIKGTYPKETGFIKDLKVVTNTEHTTKTICDSEGKGVKIYFKEPQKNLTIFEVGLMYCLFIFNKKPLDYADTLNVQQGKSLLKT